MSERKKCFLRPVDATHESILLEDRTPINIGRGPKTKIKDSRCSRNQVVLVPDFSENKVQATQLGRNACAVNGVEMKKDKPVDLLHGQKLDVLLGQYSYILEFDPPPGRKVVDVPKQTGLNEVSDSDDETLTSAPPQKKARLSTPESSLKNKYPVTSSYWETVSNDLLIYKHPKCESRTKIAAYDLDGTIITTQQGNIYAKNADDWKIKYPNVLTKLSKLYSQGWKVVVFTNQASLINSPNTTALVCAFQYKIESIVNKLKIPVEVYIAKSKGLVRKPCTGMWSAMVTRNGKDAIDMKASFYCGDAAGRVGLPKGDFSQADVLFARNVGITFFTPEEHFQGQKEMKEIRITAFDFSKLRVDLPLCEPEHRLVCANKQELIVMVGCPGSGKSHFVKTHLVAGSPAYKRVSRDELGSMPKCVEEVALLLQRGHHVVVDNTNPTIASRAKFIEIAQKMQISARIFMMNTSLAHAKHNNKFRQLTDRTHEVIGDVVLNQFFKSLESPTTNEGVTEVIRVNFWPSFTCPEQEKLYKQYLCEK